MGEIASQSQLRMSFLRWALVIVPVIVLLGFVSARIGGSGDDNVWFQALLKPEITPAGWVFALAWSLLYVLMGLSLAMVVNARGAPGRGVAIGLFAVQFILNLAWSPLFFAAHQVKPALLLLIAILVLSIATTILFGRIRAAAAWLMVPYIAWLCFAGLLTWQIDQLNPDAATLVPKDPGTQITI